MPQPDLHSETAPPSPAAPPGSENLPHEAEHTAVPVTEQGAAPERTSPLSADELQDLIAALSDPKPSPLESARTPAAEPVSGSAGSRLTTTPDAALHLEDIEALIAAVDRDANDSLSPAAAMKEEPVTQEVLDALIAEMSALQLPGKPAAPAQHAAELDTPIAGTEEDEALNKAGMDDTLAGAALDATAAHGREMPAAELNAGISGAAIIDPHSEANAFNAFPPPLPEQPAAGAEEKGLLSQADLDNLIEQALQQDKQRPRPPEPHAEAPPPITEEPPPPPPASGPEPAPSRTAPGPACTRRTFGPWLRRQFPRLAVSLLVAWTAAAATFTYLYRHQEQLPDLAALRAPVTSRAIEEILFRARERFAAGEYGEVVQLMDEALAAAAPGPMRTDAAYLRLEARYRALQPDAPQADADAVITEIERTVEGARTHPKAPEALSWKAGLHERLKDLSSAQAVYEQVVSYYPAAPNADTALFNAARIALARKRARDSVDLARRFLQQFPESAHAGEASLLIADAYALAGMTDEARSLYARTAQEAPTTAMGAQAYQRLGEMALHQGDYEAAIRYLESRLRTATTTAGNDRVYLQLARAYRAFGRLEEARNALNDLINFFPQNEVTPHAFVELSQVLDALGRRDEAVQLALQSATRFHDNPAVLANAGELLGLAGRPGPAAEMLVAADDAGAGDPTLLIAAGRHFHTADRLEEAFAAYERLRTSYPRTPQAVAGGISGAAVLYELGRPTEAVDRLESLVTTTAGTPHYLSAVSTLTGIYQDLGLRQRVVELAQQLAGASEEPEMLARAALDLFRAGATDLGRQISGRVDLARLTNETAYALLAAEGAALVDADPPRAVEKLETAALNYPDARKPEGDVALLRAYLRTDRRAAARRVVMELDGHARANPVDAPWLVQAIVAWGDHLLQIGDAREAANAYALVEDLEAGPGGFDKETQRNLDWAKFQHASALLALHDFDAGLILLEEIAQTGASWAAEAALKAEYARVEQRLRGAPAAAGGGEG